MTALTVEPEIVEEVELPQVCLAALVIVNDVTGAIVGETECNQPAAVEVLITYGCGLSATTVWCDGHLRDALAGAFYCAAHDPIDWSDVATVVISRRIGGAV